MASSKKESCSVVDNAFIISKDIIIAFPKKTDIIRQYENSLKITKKLAKLSEDNKIKHPTKKNPEDNLGDFIGESEIPKSDDNLDRESVKEHVTLIIENRNSDVTSILNEKDLVDICVRFSYNLREVTEALIDKFPEHFTISFLRSKVRPFIYSLKKDKIGYESRIEGYGYKPIFEYL